LLHKGYRIRPATRLFDTYIYSITLYPKVSENTPQVVEYTPQVVEYTPQVVECTPQVVECTPQVAEYTPQVVEYITTTKFINQLKKEDTI
jgi:hypothetical protein